MAIMGVVRLAFGGVRVSQKVLDWPILIWTIFLNRVLQRVARSIYEWRPGTLGHSGRVNSRVASKLSLLHFGTFQFII